MTAGDVTMIDPTFKADKAFEAIRSDIVSCRMMPGTLVSEPELMERFEIGRATCRVALQRLVQSGLVSSVPRQGYRIAPVTLKDIEEVFAMRVWLEPQAARLAAGRVSQAHLERLEAACRVRSSADIGNQIDFFLEANRGFHLAIAQASGNERLYRALSDLFDEMARLVALGFGVQGVRPNIEHDHAMLIEALVAGDADRSETIARRHVEVFREMTMQKVISTFTQLPEVANHNLARPSDGR